MIEYRNTLKESILFTLWVKKKYMWFYDEIGKMDWNMQNNNSPFHIVVVEHIKERNLIFKANMGRWRYLYSDIYDDNDMVEAEYLRTVKVIEEFKLFKAKKHALYDKYWFKDYPDREKVNKFIELREKKLAQIREKEEAERERKLRA